jgi:hypothetical protein
VAVPVIDDLLSHWISLVLSDTGEERPKPQGVERERPPWGAPASCGKGPAWMREPGPPPSAEPLEGGQALRASMPCGRPSRERFIGAKESNPSAPQSRRPRGEPEYSPSYGATTPGPTGRRSA